ncbi:hypothetical protein QYF61_026279 [Mycteria americana]|uniref:Uncharacterized protein n=1 Tax=Mycteria americana TaxID=33587 RepID=A0AAN7RSK3_MYCAM|nr:hypothetical protein QYF61_026279 [Mycteria americana]
MGSAASQEAALCSPLGCILKHCNKPGGDAMTKNQLKRYRNQGWPQYQWEDGEKWPENGSLKYNTVSELMLCCRGTEKWDEMPSVDMLFSLRRDCDIRKKGGLVDSKHRIGIYVLKEKKGKPRCIEWENLEEDIQLSVAPPKQPKSDSSSGNGVVRNNREEIEEKEKRGRVTLQASFVGCLEGRPGKRERKYRREKRPERTPARTDLSTGDSFSSSPAVGRQSDPIETIQKECIVLLITTPSPNWGGVQALLEYLFPTEERRRILEKAREGLIQQGAGVPNTDMYLPKEDPEWDPDTSVRNNREEIEEKEKRGRVTLQASFVGCLEGRPGKRERKYRREKRPERTPARTDLSTGDSFSSSPAVGRQSDPIETIQKECIVLLITTPSPNWGGVQALLEYLFPTEERRRILEKAREGLIQQGAGVPNTDMYLPKEDPEWDPDTSVRNNREEIEEKEKRGRVTLQASFVGCLEGRPGKRERKYRREKRPERTPARTDLSIGDSFSSSPAVGRQSDPIETIQKECIVLLITTPSPNWGGVQALLEYLFPTEERRRILEKAREGLIQQGAGVPNTDMYLPKEDPEWDPDTSVRNNREEIEEKEKRGRVTLQASFVGCLEGRPGKRERKYRREKRPERTPARTDLSTGDSFSSSPAVGRQSDPIETIQKECIVLLITTPSPNWGGVQALLEYLFPTEERRRILEKAREGLIQQGAGVPNTDMYLPKEDPEWDPDTSVRNNREEIEEKEKRGRVTLQASFVGCLEGRPGKRERKYRREKRPERTPARTDLSTGDSFSSSPAVGRQSDPIETIQKECIVLLITTPSPNWGGVQALLEYLFPTEERRRILEKAREGLIQQGAGVPNTDMYLPKEDPEWDPDTSVRNNREEIEEKEKRGRVTLQASFVGCLEGRPGKRERKYRREKRPERTPARTDLSTGDSFSSSPAVGRQSDPIETIQKECIVLLITTPSPNWGGVQALLEYLFPTEERRRILEKAREGLIQQGAGVPNTDMYLPKEDPEWDPDTSVRNNREEIEEKEKRGRVTLQASFVGCLEGRPGKRERKYRREKRPERTPARTDLSTGDSFSSSPAVGREKRPERTPARTDLSTGDSFSSSPAVGRQSDPIETIQKECIVLLITTPSPNWGGVQALLEYLFPTEERRRILEKAREGLIQQGAGVPNTDMYLPKEDPEWDPDTSVRNNREEIEEKEKRGRVTLQASFVGCLEGRPGKRERKYRREKRPERTPARTDLSTGDSFSSSPAVGRQSDPIETIQKECIVLLITTPSPNWGGVQALLEYLFPTEERRRILEKAREGLIQQGAGVPNTDMYLPKEDPEWDPDTSVRNNREEIEEKEKRGRVTLQASFVGCLEGRPGKRERKYRREKRPERTPARTDLSTGDSFSSSPAVGRQSDPIETIQKECIVLLITTPSPNWGGVQALLEYLFPTEERRRILEKAREGLIQQGAGVPNTDMYLPKEDPEWDPDTSVRNNREEIEEKEKRGRVTLQASFVGCLEGRPGKRERKYRREKRPERTPARTDLSTGDSFSSSPAVGRQSDPIETIQKECIVLLITTPSPNWGGVQALLEYLFPTEERRRILEKAREGLIQQGAGVPNTDMYLPKEDPEWDPDTSVRNNREEIEEKEKRGRVTLQASFVGCLEGRPGKRERKYRREKRPERTPARTDLSTGDSFSSSPAVGRQSDPIETIQKECIVLLITTPSPNWGGVQALLEYLFPTEERRRILEKAREGLIQQGAGVPNTDMYLPKEDPEWDPDTSVRNNREEIEEKEKRGRVTLQASFVGCLEGRPGKRERKYRREKRPERAPARTDLSTGDSFSSSPAVGRQSDPIETIQKECIVLLITTPSPNWGGVQALLEYLFPTEERRRILEKAREGLIQQGAGVPNTDMYLPKEDPEWDPDTSVRD